MAITQSTALRNNQADQVSPLIDANGGGNLVLRTSGDAEVATIQMNATAFAAAVAGVITANPTTDDTSATGGTVAKFTLEDGIGTEVMNGSVTGTSGGGDIEMSSTTVGNGSTVSLTSLTYTNAP